MRRAVFNFFVDTPLMIDVLHRTFMWIFSHCKIFGRAHRRCSQCVSAVRTFTSCSPYNLQFLSNSRRWYAHL